MTTRRTHVCSKCHATKPTAEFPVARDRSSGVYPYCRACKSAMDRFYYEGEKLSPIPRVEPRPTRKKRCDACKTWKLIGEFNRCATSADFHHSTCRVCKAAQRARYAQQKKQRDNDQASPRDRV
jgi:hypothetical protein